MNLNEEDKKWIRAELTEQLKEQLTEQLKEQRLALEDRITDMETKLLTEFHKWASPTELRIQSHATAIRAIDLELELTKERVAKLEPKQ